MKITPLDVSLVALGMALFFFFDVLCNLLNALRGK